LSKVADFNLPYLNFAENFGDRKLESWAFVWRCLRDAKFNRFDTIPARDKRTDRRTDTRRRLIARYSRSSRGKDYIDQSQRSISPADDVTVDQFPVQSC